MPRKEVEIFSLCMEEKLRRNDHKGGWEGVGQHTLFDRLRAEVDELEQALANEPDVNVMYEAADIANFAMMIAWNAMRGAGHKVGVVEHVTTIRCGCRTNDLDTGPHHDDYCDKYTPS